MRKLVVTVIAAFFTLLLFLSFLRPAVACTFAGGTVPAPCTFTLEAVDSQCVMDITAVTVTSLIDNNKINESATYIDLGGGGNGAAGRVALVAREDKPINTGQSMTLYSVRDAPLPSGASVTVVASGISDTKLIGARGCTCPIILADTTAYFDPESGLVFANGTIRGTCLLSGMVFAILNRTTGLASERLLGFPPDGTFLVPSVRTYTSEEASRELQVLLVAYGYNGALGAYLPPIGSFKDFRIAFPKTSIVAEPGKPVDVTVSVTNFNNEPDTYAVTTRVPQDWSGESVAFSIGPNSVSNQLIRITPSLLTFSETQNIVVGVASSSTGKTKTASFLISPSALKPTLQSYLYPPKVIMIGRPLDAKAVLNATSPSTVRYFFYTEPFVKTDSSVGKTSIPAGLSGLAGLTTTVRDICALPDSAKSLRKMNVYWSVLWDVFPAKDPVLIKKVLSKIDSYRGSVTTPSFSATRSNATAIVSSIELHQNVDSRIAAILLDIETLKAELDVEENKTLASPVKACKPVANVDLVLDFISYSDASESKAISNDVVFASGEVLSARLLDENGNAVPIMNLGPGEVKELRAEITNGDTDTRQFTVEVTDGVLANFITLAESQVTIGGGQTDTVGLTIRMPTVISGTKNATLVVSSSPYIKSLPIMVTMSGPELSGPASYAVEPGVPATFSFFLKNNDKTEDTYSISVAGAPEVVKWLSVPQPTLKIAGGKDAKIQVKTSTPSTAPIGTYNFTLIAYSQKSGDSVRFDSFLLMSGEFKALRARASEVDAINDRIKEKCPGTAINAAMLKDARSLITAGKLSEAKTKIDIAKSEGELALADCTSFKMPLALILFVLGGLAFAYFWLFVRKPAPPPLRPPPSSQTGRPPLAGAPLSRQRGGTELPTSSKDDEETWI